MRNSNAHFSELTKSEWLTLVFLSTHSKQDKVGLFRFCFFVGGTCNDPSSFLIGDPKLVLSVGVGDIAVKRAGGPGPICSIFVPPSCCCGTQFIWA
jgi:hypothetical protein